jgi:hypothetical protein
MKERVMLFVINLSVGIAAYLLVALPGIVALTK